LSTFGAGCLIYGEDLLATGGAAGSTTTPTGGTGGTGGTTMSSGTPCGAPAECPTPASPCQKAACTDGFCATENLPANTELPDPMPGDCHTIVCDSAGGQITVEASKDIPNDGKFCTIDTCELGAPVHTPNLGKTCNEDGGKHCNDLGACVECATDDDCAFHVCKDYVCAPPTCNDGTKNGTETDIDCGGACQHCATGDACNVNTDCKSGLCTNKICKPSCTDELKNQTETDVDCGGTCPKCADGLTCATAVDCQSGVCTATKCAAPTCMDGKKNGDESGVDCGGLMCATCALNHLVINEVDYDQPNTDTAEFVEIYNATVNTVSLAGLKLVLVDGAMNVPYGVVDLAPGGSLAPGQYLVVLPKDALPPAGVVGVNFSAAQNQLQNGLSGGSGSPDGLALIDDTANTVIDAVSYEGGITTANLTTWGLGTVSLVEGVALNASVKDEAGGSLCRYPNAKDTDSSAADWVLCSAPTPGAPNQL